MNNILVRAVDFIQSCASGLPGEYRFHANGHVSLYASCYAAMALHLVGKSMQYADVEQLAWSEYINSWQDKDSGSFIGPELNRHELTRPELDDTYLRLHLTIHALSALDVLGGIPVYPLKFAHKYATIDYLKKWLACRNWHNAWQEGNSLLCIGQLLLHLRDIEQCNQAQEALDYYFDWLDEQQDPATGLWGTNGFCDAYEAVYGGSHQLLVYWYCNRPVHHTERMIDTVLKLQSTDGSFTRVPGGGSCEDADAIEILVNVVKRTGYRQQEVSSALDRANEHLQKQQRPEGGFVYQADRAYMQNGLLRTHVPPNTGEIFSTWYRLHTLALISQVVLDSPLHDIPWQFNNSCSMGWHNSSVQRPYTLPQTVEAVRQSVPSRITATKRLPLPRKLAGKIVDRLMNRLPVNWVLKIGQKLLPRYVRTLPPSSGLQLLLGLDMVIDALGQERSYEEGRGLHVHYWRFYSQNYLVNHLSPGSNVLHIGCGDGSLSYTLATGSQAMITATDSSKRCVAEALTKYHHPRLSFVDADQISATKTPYQYIVFTDLRDGKPAWNQWQQLLGTMSNTLTIAQLTCGPKNWRDLNNSSDSSTTQSHELLSLCQALVPSGCTIVEVKMAWATLYAKLLLSGSANRLTERQP